MHPTFSILFFTICIFLTIYYFSEYLHINIVRNLKYYTNEVLYYLKLKERPKQEPFIGMIRSLLKMVLLIPKLVMNVGNIFTFLINSVIGSVELISGASMALALGFESLFKGVAQFGVFMLYSLEFMLTHLFCFLKIVFTAPSCVIWYIIETIGKIIYLIPMFFFALLTIIGLDGKAIETGIWDGLENIDTLTFSLIGIHIIHYPKWIRDQCYNCRRLKMGTVGDQFTRTFTTISREFPDDAAPGISVMNGGGKRLMSALKKFMTLL